MDTLSPHARDAAPPKGRQRMTRLRLMLLALSMSMWALVIGIRLFRSMNRNVYPM